MHMRKDYFEDLVASMKFDKEIPREELRAFFKVKKRVFLEKGAYFLRAGEVSDRIGYNVSGLMRLFYVSASGTEINKHFCVEKSVAVNYDAFLRREKSKLFIQALEDTRLLVIDYDDYRYLRNRHPCWQHIEKKLSEMLVRISHKREAEILLMDAKERYAQFLRDCPNLADRVSQYHIASYLGITPESLSRIRAHR
jgi:CRP-like cAMP-binding protein